MQSAVADQLAAPEFGRVQLTDERAEVMWRSKLVHGPLFVIFLLAGVVRAGSGDAFSGAMTPRAAFLLGGLYECYTPGATVTETFKRMVIVLAAFGFGIAVFAGLFTMGKDYSGGQ